MTVSPVTSFSSNLSDIRVKPEENHSLGFVIIRLIGVDWCSESALLGGVVPGEQPSRKASRALGHQDTGTLPGYQEAGTLNRIKTRKV